MALKIYLQRSFLCVLLFVLLSMSSLLWAKPLESQSIQAQVAQLLQTQQWDFIFDGQVFGLPTQAWQTQSSQSLDSVWDRLETQTKTENPLFNQMTVLGRDVLLKGEQASWHYTLHLKRLSNQKFNATLSLIQTTGEQPLAFPTWVPPNSQLLMDVQSTPQQGQQIFKTPLGVKQLNRYLNQALTKQQWQSASTDWKGFQRWQKGKHNVLLYLVAQDDGTALYVFHTKG